MLAYALRHGHVHLTEVLAKAGTEGVEGAGHAWFAAFLEPRPARSAVAVVSSAATGDEPEPEAEASVGYQRRHSYALSPWQARALVTTWLEQQAEHGRSQLLVPELLALEEQMRARTRDDDDDDQARARGWLHGLCHLVQHLRSGIGAFWAPHYEASPQTARGMLGANVAADSPLHLSPAVAQLRTQQLLCLPLRVRNGGKNQGSTPPKSLVGRACSYQ